MVVPSVSAVFRFAVSPFWHYARFMAFSHFPSRRFSQSAVFQIRFSVSRATLSQSDISMGV